jgi:hypothetical protein
MPAFIRAGQRTRPRFGSIVLFHHMFAVIQMLKYRGTRQTSGWTDLTTLLVGCFRFAQARDGVCHIGLTCRLVRTDYAGQDANLQHRWISIHENDMPKERAAQIQPVSLISKPRIA